MSRTVPKLIPIKSNNISTSNKIAKLKELKEYKDNSIELIIPKLDLTNPLTIQELAIAGDDDVLSL